MADQITKAGIDYNLHFFAASYGVSLEAVIAYEEKHKKYPVLYYVETDSEEQIINELNMIERLLKIKKIKNV